MRENHSSAASIKDFVEFVYNRLVGLRSMSSPTTDRTQIPYSKRRKRSDSFTPIDCRARRKIVEVILDKKITRAQLAREVDLSWPTFDRLVAGLLRPNVDLALKLRQMFGIELDDWKPIDKRAA